MNKLNGIPTRPTTAFELRCLGENGHREAYLANERRITELRDELKALEQRQSQIMLDAVWQRIEERLDDERGTGDEWLTLGETAAYLKVANSTVYSYIANGQITRYGASNAPRFRKSDLDQFIECRGKTAS